MSENNHENNLSSNKQPPPQQQPLRHGYNDCVLYSVKGIMCKALVIQSQLVPVPDRSAPGGTREEEHLSLLYLDPTAGRPVMTQAETENAITRQHGVAPASERNRSGWYPIENIRIAKNLTSVSLEADANTQEGEKQESQYSTS